MSLPQLENGSDDLVRVVNACVDAVDTLNGLAVTDTVAPGTITATELASDAVTTAKILNANVTTAKLATNAVTGVKIAAGALKYLAFTGVAAAGAITLTGAAVGDKVVGVANTTDGGSGSANFESTITVVNQIQQSSASDLSTKKYTVLLISVT
jgi:hypothetical protein